MLGIEDFDIGTRFDIACERNGRAFLPQNQSLGSFGMLAQRDSLNVEDDVGHILANTRD